MFCVTWRLYIITKSGRNNFEIEENDNMEDFFAKTT